jgi:hypothetical protein
VKCGGSGAVGATKGKGGGLPKGKSAGGVNFAQDFSFLSGAEYLDKRQVGAAKGGAGNGCGEIERGHSTGATGLAAHIAYASNGYYITAASCFIKKRFSEYKQAGGGSVAAASPPPAGDS